MADEAFDLEQRAATSRQGRIIWPGLILLGWLLYELTAQPALAVTALCLKFGWEDFRTALWLRRRDPARGRAWAGFFLYLSSGLWKAAITAILLLIAYIVGMALAAPRNPGPGQAGVNLEQELIVASLTGLGGICLAMLTTALAVELAWSTRTKLWLNRSLRLARRADCWPPSDEAGGGINRVGLLTLPVLIIAWLASLVVIIVVAMRGNAQKDLQGLHIGIIMVGWFAGIFGIYLMQNFLERRVFARSPAECWGSSPDAPSGLCQSAESWMAPS
jgi:hypothetical protein